MPLIFGCLVALSVVGILFSYIVDGLEILPDALATQGLNPDDQ